MYSFDEARQIVRFFNEQNVAIKDWDILQKSVLMELCDNGLATYTESSVEVTPENIYQLDEIERKMLGLPNEYPYDMYVEANGSTLTQGDFNYKISFYSFFPGGRMLPYEVKGCFVVVDEATYLLSKEQYALYNAIHEFNSLDISEKDKSNNFIRFSDIKGLSKSAAAKLDSYLTDTDVCVPNKIKVLLDYNNDEMHLSASIDSEDSDQFTERFNKKEQVKGTYQLKKKGGKRVHVVFDQDKVVQLETIKKYEKTADRETINKIMESPESFFDTNLVDIHEFYSDRVIEKGLYQPKYYSFICPYKSEWVPGIKVNDNVNGSKNLFFPKKENLEKFESKVQEALKEGKMSVEWENTLLNVNEVLPQITKLKENCYNQKDTAKFNSPKGTKKISENEVLIIEENAEELGYSEQSVNMPCAVEHYNFHECTNLNPSIKLKQHQIEGVAWLQYLYLNKYKGCLLADDMGLGKTLQILYFIEWHRMQNVGNIHKPYLIVAPVSLLENWQREYQKFFVGTLMQVSIVMSNDLEKDFAPKDVSWLQSLDLILTNYESVRNRQFNFCAVDYAFVVLDEAQKAKTPGSLVTNSVKALKADFKIAMTGTPVENTLVDLWCIMDFSIPGLLGNAREFAKLYQNPLKDKDTDIEQLGKKLRSKLGRFFERRLKLDVAKDLPPKHIYKKKQEMSDLQKRLYRDELNAVVATRQNGKTPQGMMFKVIAAFRQICDSPYISVVDYSQIDIDKLINSSSKLSVTINILDKIRNDNEKVIIFTDHKDTQRLLRNVVFRRYGLDVSIINGETPATAKIQSQKLSRQQTVDEFQNTEGFNVIIMSPLAAGMGLNITGANNVIHYSRFWNPTKEQQATDRAYRIGQKKDVNVYYPMSVSKDFRTFDVIIDALLAKKTELADATLFPTVRTEIKQQELYESLVGESAEKSQDNYLEAESVDIMNDYRFEAFIAALYKKMGYKTILTSECGDKGIDVLALNGDTNYAIQVKHSKNPIGIQGVQEAKSGCEYYSNRWGFQFIPMLLSNSSFTTGAIDLANGTGVKLIGRDVLFDMLLSNKVANEDVVSCELHRLDRA